MNNLKDSGDMTSHRGGMLSPPNPVRRIPISTRSITGNVDGQGFESALERDFLMQLAWDEDVAWFVTQPVKIPYEFPRKRPRSYTPDVLVEFDSVLRNGRAPLLCEVKYRSELAKNWKELKRKFRAAQAYCRERNWRFVILDERSIRSIKLSNIQFLWRYRGASYDKDLAIALLQILQLSGGMTMQACVDAACSASVDLKRDEAIWTFWVLAADRKTEFDIDTPIGINTLFHIRSVSDKNA